MTDSTRQSITLAIALLLLDASLTFENIWPTPAIRWSGELSIELAALLLFLGVARRAPGTSPRAARWLALLWLILFLGHYADVTAPALYGRDVNLYWDLRYVPDVAAMLTRAVPAWLLIAIAGAVVLFVIAAYATMRWAIGRVLDAMARPVERRVLGAVAIAIVAGFVLEPIVRPPPDVFETRRRWFPTPVTGTYARQTALAVSAVTRSVPLAPSPPMDSDLALVRDTDVLLMFIESYGAVTFERPELSGPIASSRSALEKAVRDTRRGVVSAFVESPTFGGSSWFAHITLLSGIEVGDPHTNAQLLTEKRETLATVFARAGFRTIAWMPGLRQAWPEGKFYGFTDIFNAGRIDYHGPEFGWFAIPDQFSLARLDALELSAPSRARLFVFFPTLTTHVPFGPTPVYQPDWPRMLTDTPYDPAQIVASYATEPDYVDFGPGYARAVSYAYQTIAGFLQYRADRDFVLILIGDHQPPALVSGEGAPWDVPVHVITNRTAVLERLRTRGFHTGITPARPALGKMHTLLPILLDGFGNR